MSRTSFGVPKQRFGTVLREKGHLVFLVLALSGVAMVKFLPRAQGVIVVTKTVTAAGRFGDPKPKKPKYRAKLAVPLAGGESVVDAGNTLTLSTDFKAVSTATQYTNGPTYRVATEGRFDKPTKTAGNFILQPDFVAMDLGGKRRWVADSPASLYNATNVRKNPKANGAFTALARVPGPGTEVTAELQPNPSMLVDKPARAPLALTIRATLTITNASITPSPVPVGSGATISYTLSRASTVSIPILSSTGAVARNLVTNGQRGAGANSEAWDGKNNGGAFVAGGAYVLKTEAAAGVEQVSASKPFSVQ